jgi:hypothetical protein
MPWQSTGIQLVEANLVFSGSQQSKDFGWRTACDNLATKRNKFQRTLEVDNTYRICGMMEEDSFHATVSCTKPGR